VRRRGTRRTVGAMVRNSVKNMLIDADLPVGVPVPLAESATVVVPPPADGRGHWAGAPSVCLVDGTFYLAYRLRCPDEDRRGYEIVVARSTDGIDFETLVVLSKESFGAASFERPALVFKPDGTWRIYVSCATPGSYDWWIDALDAPDPSGFDPDRAKKVPLRADSFAVKDPVVQIRDGKWLLWVCCHPLDDPMATDRMFTRFASGPDGIEWSFRGEMLRGTSGHWDMRGVRVTEVLHDGDMWFAYYDGRSSKEDNAEECTGGAIGRSPDTLYPMAIGPVATSPWGSGSLRYLSIAGSQAQPQRLFFEACLPDGSHALMTQSFR